LNHIYFDKIFFTTPLIIKLSVLNVNEKLTPCQCNMIMSPHINPIQMICLSFHEVIDRVAQNLTLTQKGQMSAITRQFKSIGMQER